MADDRRSGRVKKTVNYSKFGELSDDDFADTTPPPRKKNKSNEKVSSKSKVTEKKKSAVQLDSEVKNDDTSLRSKKSRKPPTDRLFDRELEEALQISLLETGGSQEDTPPVLSPVQAAPADSVASGPSPPRLAPAHSGGRQKSVQAEVNILPKGCETLPSVEKNERCHNTRSSAAAAPKLPGTIVMDDSIQVLHETKSRRQRVKKAVIESDSEDDAGENFASKKDEESDDEDEESSAEDSPSESEAESDDSDFAPKSKKKPAAVAKKGKTPQKKSNPTSKPNQTSKLKNITNTRTSQKQADKAGLVPANTKPPSETKPASSTFPTKSPQINKSVSTKATPSPSLTGGSKSVNTPRSSPAIAKSSQTVSRSVSSTVRSSPSVLTAQWKPPARAGGGGTSASPAVQSPVSGLRLGLSRNQRVKPLHASPKVS